MTANGVGTPSESWADESAATAAKPIIRQADHAVARTAAGLYPTCEICGARIDMQRLRASSTATTCAACSRKRGGKKRVKRAR